MAIDVYLQIDGIKGDMENVMIAHMDQVMSDGGPLQDNIGLRFSKLKWRYTQHAEIKVAR